MFKASELAAYAVRVWLALHFLLLAGIAVTESTTSEHVLSHTKITVRKARVSTVLEG